MSYDLDQLHQKYGIQVASVQFGTSVERSSIALIAAVAGAAPVIHQVVAAASIYSVFRISVSTAAGTSVWVGMTGPANFYEGTRIMGDSSTALTMNATGVGADAGTGFLRVFFSMQKSTGLSPSNL
jgi:hypothetical protein